MALMLPTADAILAGAQAAIAREKKAAAPDPDEEYNRLTPAQKAEVDARTELALNPRGAMGEIGTGLVRGLKFTLPTMVGEALQATGKEGDLLHGVGSGIKESVAPNDYRYLLDPDNHGAVVNAVAAGGEMLAPSLSAGALMAIPGVGPAGAAAGGAALFGASQFQNTYEKAKKAGKGDGEAFAAGLETGAIEAGGEAIGTFAGLKLISGAGKALLKGATADAAYQSLKNPKLMLPLMKETAKTAAVEVGTEMGQGAGQAAVEQAHGIDTVTPWEAATHSIGPTLGMMAFMGPLAALGMRSRQQAQKTAMDAADAVLDNDKASGVDQVRASKTQADIIAEVTGNKEDAQLWRLDRLTDAVSGKRARNQAEAMAMRANVQAEQRAADLDRDEQAAMAAAEVENAQLVGTMDAEERMNQARAIQQRQQAALDRRQAAAANLVGDPNAGITEAGVVEPVPAIADALHPAPELNKLAPEPSALKKAADLERMKPTPPLKNALQVELERVQAQRAVDSAHTVAEREAAQKKADELEVLAVEAKRVRAAEFADSAIGGKITGNTPLMRDDFWQTMKEAAEDTGQDIPKGSVPSINRILAKANGKANFGLQMAALKQARDGMKDTGTATYAAIDALITKLDSAKAAPAGMPAAAIADINAQLSAALSGVQNETTPQVVPRAKPGPAIAPQPKPAAAAPKGNEVQGDAQPVRGNESPAEVAPAANKQEQWRMAQEMKRLEKAGAFTAEDSAALAANLQEMTAPVAPVQPVKARAQKAAKAKMQENNIVALEAEIVTAQAQLDAAAKAGTAQPGMAAKLDKLNKALAKERKAKAGSAVHGNTGAGANLTPAQRLIQAAEEARLRIRDILAQKLANKDGFDAWGAQPTNWGLPEPKENMAVKTEHRREADRLMGKRDEWVYTDDWVERVVGKRLGLKFEQEFKKEARVVDAANIGTGKDLAAQDEEAATLLEEQRSKERQFSSKEAMRDAESDPFEDGMDSRAVPQLNAVEVQQQLSGAKNLGEALDLLTRSEYASPLQKALARALARIESIRNASFNLTGKDNGRANGTYYPNDHAVDINQTGGVNTVLHEAMHAATYDALSVNKQFLKEMTKLLERARAAMGERASGIYGLTDEHEFVSEAFSDPDFQFMLSQIESENPVEQLPWSPSMRRVGMERGLGPKGTLSFPNLWAEFKDLVRRMLGLPKGMRTLLDDVMDLTNDSGVRLGRYTDEQLRGAPLDSQTVAGTFDNLKQTINGIDTSKIPDMLLNAPSKARQVLLGLSTAAHIKDWVAKSPLLNKMHAGVKAFFDTYDLKTRMIQDSRQEFHDFGRRVELRLHALKDYDGNSARMQELGGEMSRLNIDLNKTFAENQALNKELTAADQQAFGRLQNKWKALDPELQALVLEGVKLNRKYYIMNTAAVIYNMMGTFVTTHPHPGMADAMAALDLAGANVPTSAPVKDAMHIDTHSQHFAAQLDALFAWSKQLPETDDVRKSIDFIKRYYYAAVRNPYLHLGRDGNHFASFDAVVDKANQPGKIANNTALGELAAKYDAVVGDVDAGSKHVFMRFTTMQQQQAFRKEAEEAGFVEPKSMKSGRLNEQGVLDNVAGVPQALRQVMKKMDDVMDAVPTGAQDDVRRAMSRIIIEMLPESSSRKANAQRKDGGRPGYDADFVHSFSKRAEGMSSSIANAYTMPKFDQALRDMKDQIELLVPTNENKAQEQAQEIFMELAKRFSNSINPVESPKIDAAKALGYNFYLALSPAFMLVNTLQPYHLSLPVMGGRHGFASTAKAMFSSAGTSMSVIHDTYVKGWKEGKFTGVVDAELVTDKLSPEHKEMVTSLMRLGRLDFTQAHELGRMASGGSHGWALASKVASLGSHITEINNRLTTALSAYDLEMKKAGPAGETVAEHKQRAIKYAVDTVDATQFNYSDHNTARFLGRHGALGPVTPLLASFQQYSFQSIELLARLTRDAFGKINPQLTADQKKEAQRALGGITTMTAVLTGVLGLPFANVIAAAADAIGGDDDDPLDTKIALRNWLADVFGKDIAEVISRGAPRAIGIDISQRAGMQDLLPGSRFLTDKREFEDKIKDGALSAFGPAVNAAVDIGTMGSHLANGELLKALTLGLPLALRNPAKAVGVAQDGYTTKTGNELPIDVTTWDIMNQALGFTPAKKAEQSEANFAAKTREAQLKKHMGRVSNDLYLAVEKGENTDEAIEAYRKAIMKNPQHAGNPNTALKARAEGRVVAAQSGTGVVSPAKQLPMLTEEYRFTNIKPRER